MAITKTETKFLNELFKDCITYGLEEKEAVEYVERRFKQISLSSYKLNEGASQVWLNHFTRIGFVEHHKKQIEDIQKIQDDSLKRFYLETQNESRDESKIKSLKFDIRENARLLSELGLGTPIISGGHEHYKTNDDYDALLSDSKDIPFWLYDGGSIAVNASKGRCVH